MAKQMRMGSIKGGASAGGWVKNPGSRISAVHTYHAGKALAPGVKSAKGCCSGKAKKS